MAALTISAPIVARAGSFAGRKLATNATNGTVGKTAARAVWMPGSTPPRAPRRLPALRLRFRSPEPG